MAISISDIDFLTSPRGEQLLTRLASEDLSVKSVLPLITRLRKDYTAEQVSAALETAQLRLRAAEKFGTLAAKMLFTRSGLEQASDPLVSRYRAARVGNQNSIVDACCGIGGDAFAFAAAGAHVVGVDRDAVRIAIARYNAAALGLSTQFVEGDVTVGLPPADHIFFDPGRRDEKGNRIYNVEQYKPPLSTIQGWSTPSIVVKLSPAVDMQQLAAYDGLVEFISVNGDLKEAVLWRVPGLNGTRATLLMPDKTLHWDASVQGSQRPLSEPRSWLVEPDPALLRAGFVQSVADAFGASLLDETIAYLTSDTRPESPWVRAWQIRDWMPFNLKHLRTYLRRRQIGQVTVKKRGTAVTPESLIPQLKLAGDATCVLVLTRCRGEQIVLICDDYEQT